MGILKDHMNGPCRIIVHDDSIQASDEAEQIIDRLSETVIEEGMRKSAANKKNEKS